MVIYQAGFFFGLHISYSFLLLFQSTISDNSSSCIRFQKFQVHLWLQLFMLLFAWLLIGYGMVLLILMFDLKIASLLLRCRLISSSGLHCIFPYMVIQFKTKGNLIGSYVISLVYYALAGHTIVVFPGHDRWIRWQIVIPATDGS